MQTLSCGKSVVLLAVYVLAFTGCSEPPNTFLGSWEVDQVDLAREMEDDFPGDSEERIEIRNRFIKAHQSASWSFNEDGTYVHDGAWPSHGSYRIFDHGEDWVVLRVLYEGMEGEEPSADYSEVNGMSPQEWIKHEGQRDGVSSLLIGFELLGEDLVREFSLVVSDGKITDERDTGVLFNRVD